MRNTMLAVLMMVVMVAGQIPTSGLVARYDFTGGALTDGSGSGRNLTQGSIGATLTADRDLFPNNAYLFERQNSGYYYGADEGLPIGESNRTVSFWISLQTKGDTVQQVLAWGVPRSFRDTSDGFRIVFRRDTLCVQQHGVRYAKTRVTTAQFPGAATGWDAPWTHVTIVIEGTQTKWYINGALHATVEFPELATTVSANSYLIVGDAAWRPLSGKLDEILIYDHALTSTEIRGIYEPQVSTVTHHEKVSKIAHSTRDYYSLDGRILKNTVRTRCPLTAVRQLHR